jgi:hypothetical protein
MPGPYDELEKKAEALENQSKIEFSKKNFISTVSLLEQTKAIYAQLGFHGKIGMINQRIARVRNLIKLEEQGGSVRTKSEQEFQKRVDKALDEKQKYQQKQLAQQKVLSPEIRSMLEKIKMITEKAEREEKLGKYPRVMRRYEHVLELYQTIPKDSMDLSSNIVEIEKKLSVLRTKM